MSLVAWAFLLLAVIGCWLTVNAHRPNRRFAVLRVPSFFAGWLHSELVLHALALQVAVVAGMLWLGALEHWAGWLALALTACSWGGMVGLLQQARTTGRELGSALRSGLGADYKRAYPPEVLRRVRRHLPWSQLAAPLWMRHDGLQVVRDIPYVPGGHRRHQLDIYRRPDMVEHAPVLVQIHGGAWIVGNKRQQGLPLMFHLAAQGWICVAINYRLSPRATFPDHIVDVKRALAWVREHIAEYGGDPDFIALTGGSAGGHLSTLAALTAHDPSFQPGFEDVDTRVRACVPFYGVYDMIAFGRRRVARRSLDILWMLEKYVMKRRFADDRAVFERASPIAHVHADAPAFFVIHGDRDNLVPVGQARRFVDALRGASRAPVVYAELRGAHHAFDVFYSPRTQQVIRGVDRFLSWVYADYLSKRPCSEDHVTSA